MRYFLFAMALGYVLIAAHLINNDEYSTRVCAVILALFASGLYNAAKRW